MVFISSRYGKLVERCDRLVTLTLGSVCEAGHTRLHACTHMCVVCRRLATKLNERSWERAERVRSQTCSHTCLMK